MPTSKARALTDNFAAQWLQLKKLNDARPSTEFFPTFNGPLKQAMRDEVTTFFDKLREEDGSLLDLLDAGYTYVNEPLAAHYGIDGVKGPAFRKVALAPGQHRGGLLGMAGVLTLTSHTFRTSPTQRGKYVLEVVFGTPPPPPPPNAGQLKNDKPGDKKQVTTFREQLAQPRHPGLVCGVSPQDRPAGLRAGQLQCHRRLARVDPGEPARREGRAPDRGDHRGRGTPEIGLAEAERRLRPKRGGEDDGLRAGRELDYHDECAVRETLAALQRDDYRISALVRGVVESVPFRSRRAAATSRPDRGDC